MSDALPVFFAVAVGFGVLMYVVFDGFDLGVGILFPLAPSDAARDTMMNSIAPVWDGSETWLVLGGTTLLAAFPVVYAEVLPAFYLPIMVMLFALIFRGIAFEFRFRSKRLRPAWDWAFAGGSGLAALMQGMILGAFLGGLAPEQATDGLRFLPFVGGFSLASGLGVMVGYALLGSTWLIFKGEGEVLRFARKCAPVTLAATLSFIGLVSIWTPLTHVQIRERWFSLPNIIYLSPVPFLTAALAAGIWSSLRRGGEVAPFLLSIGLFGLGFLGLGVSLWPYAVPYSITIWQAANAPRTLAFLGVGVAILLPVTLAHLGYAHFVFRGKTRSGGYGH